MKTFRLPKNSFFQQVPVWFLSVVALIFMTAGFVGYVGYAQEGGKIVKGVYVNQVDLGGKTPGEAREILRRRFDGFLHRPIVLKDKDFRPSFVPCEVGITLDYSRMIGDACRLGHQGGIFRRVWERLSLLIRPRNLPLEVRIDQGVLQAFYRLLELQVNVEPVSAQIIVDQSGKVQKTSSRIGRRLNLERLTREIQATIWRDERAVLLPVETVRPALIEEEIERWSLDTVMGIFTTRFNPREIDRAHNLKVAASALNNCLVPAGQVFSFNKQVGPRVQEKGYREAPVIVKRKLVSGVGGGVCQVSGTLYNALLLAGFSEIGRANHSLPSSYLPLGRDATVVYGGADLTFKNTMASPVLIASAVNPDGLLTVAVLGRKTGNYDIRLESIVKKTTPFTVIEAEDPTLPVGERKVEEVGKNGYEVELWRLWIGPDQKVTRRERVNYSFYPPVPSLVKVGTMAAPGQETKGSG